MEDRKNVRSSGRGTTLKRIVRPISLFTAFFALAFLLASCAGPRYGEYGGHGGHHYLKENSAGGYYNGSR